MATILDGKAVAEEVRGGFGATFEARARRRDAGARGRAGGRRSASVIHATRARRSAFARSTTGCRRRRRRRRCSAWSTSFELTMRRRNLALLCCKDDATRNTAGTDPAEMDGFHPENLGLVAGAALRAMHAGGRHATVACPRTSKPRRSSSGAQRRRQAGRGARCWPAARRSRCPQPHAIRGHDRALIVAVCGAVWAGEGSAKVRSSQMVSTARAWPVGAWVARRRAAPGRSRRSPAASADDDRDALRQHRPRCSPRAAQCADRCRAPLRLDLSLPAPNVVSFAPWPALPSSSARRSTKRSGGMRPPRSAAASRSCPPTRPFATDSTPARSAVSSSRRGSRGSTRCCASFAAWTALATPACWRCWPRPKPMPRRASWRGAPTTSASPKSSRAISRHGCGSLSHRSPPASPSCQARACSSTFPGYGRYHIAHDRAVWGLFRHRWVEKPGCLGAGRRRRDLARRGRRSPLR